MIVKAGFEIEEATHTRNAQMSFLWWVRPQNNPPEVVKEIRKAFALLSPEDAKEHYTVEPAGDDFFFFMAYVRC